MLDRILAGEPVEATEDVLGLAELAEEVEAIFTAPEPTAAASRRGMRMSLEAFQDAAPRHVIPSRTRRIAARALVAAAMLVALPSVGWAASENALPGDLLYPVKRGFEQIRLSVAASALDQATIELDIAAERLGEAARARALGLDEAARAAVAGYADAMAGFDRSIADARLAGIDVTALLAVAGELVERHEELLEALVGDGRPAGASAAMSAAHPDGDQGSQASRAQGNGKAHGKANGKAKGHAKGGGRERAEQGDEARDEGREHSEDRAGGGGGNDGGRGQTGETEAVVPPETTAGPGKAEGAPHGRAEGHVKHGPPPHGHAKGHGKNAEPPPP